MAKDSKLIRKAERVTETRKKMKKAQAGSRMYIGSNEAKAASNHLANMAEEEYEDALKDVNAHKRKGGGRILCTRISVGERVFHVCHAFFQFIVSDFLENVQEKGRYSTLIFNSITIANRRSHFVGSGEFLQQRIYS